MYDIIRNGALAQILNQFSAPMFALERAHRADTFRFVHINSALQLAAQCDPRDIFGKSLHNVLPLHDNGAVADRFDQCAEGHEVIRFHDTFRFSNDQTLWDVTLQPAVGPDGSQRIVATCIQEPVAAPPPETMAFDDIQYLSSIADFQLQNLISLFETCQGQDIFEAQAEQRIEKLSGMCRTVQRAVADIKKCVRSEQFHHDAQPLPLEARAVPQRQAMFNRCGTLKAMTEVSSEHSK